MSSLGVDDRPLAFPEDPLVITSACDSTPSSIRRRVQREDRWQCADQSLSLYDLLAGACAADDFVGGTVYQAWSSHTDYARWHSPIGGTIVSSVAVVAGGPEVGARMADRAVIIIDADDSAIGSVAFVPSGLKATSSCVMGPGINRGVHVNKGDALGFFRFGDSSHCLIFEFGAIDRFALHAVPSSHQPPAALVRARTMIARAADSR